MSALATYTVHEPPQTAADRIDRADELAFVKDGFSMLTAVFPPLGFAANGMWAFALAYLLGVGALGGLLSALSIGPLWISLIITAINAYLAFEMSTLKRWALERRGWRTVGTVNGKTIDECERRFMEAWLPTQPPITASVRDDATTRTGGGGDALRQAFGDLAQRFKPSGFKN